MKGINMDSTNEKTKKLMVDGDEMDYVVFGSGIAPLVILPGLSDGIITVKGKKLMLSRYYKIFAKDFRVYIFSRKHGLEKGYTTKDMARDQASAMELLGIGKADVVGISQGGMIAQHLAAGYPRKVIKLVLAVTVSRQNPTLQTAVGGWIKMAEEDDYVSLVIDTVEKTYTKEKINQLKRAYPVLKRVGKPKSFDRFIIQANACLTHDAYEELSKIICPVLVIGGGDDRIAGENSSKEMAGKITNSELVVYDGFGHGAYEEAKEFNRRILDFLLGIQ